MGGAYTAMHPAAPDKTRPLTRHEISPFTTSPCKQATHALPLPSYPSAPDSSRARPSPCMRSAACALKPRKRPSRSRMRRRGRDYGRRQGGRRRRGGKLRGWGRIFSRSEWAGGYSCEYEEEWSAPACCAACLCLWWKSVAFCLFSTSCE